MTQAPDVLRVRAALEASWEPSTAYLGVDDPERPSLGQCYPTARVLQLLYPQLEIAEGLVQTPTGTERHFWNVARSDGVDLHLDLTWQQFPHGSRVTRWRVRDRAGLGDSPATVRRVERLLASVRAHLDESAPHRHDGPPAAPERSSRPAAVGRMPHASS